MGKRRDEGVENFGTLQLPLGGKYGYRGVRKVRKGRFQGYTPRKSHTTADFETPQQAAVALAAKRQDLQLGLDEPGEGVPGGMRGAHAHAPPRPAPARMKSRH